MKKVLIPMAAAGLVALALVGTAAAARPHFVSGPTFTANGGQLTVSGKLAGLGNKDVTIVVEATAVTTCTNRGGNVPPGQTETVRGSVTNLRPENGNVVFSVTTGRASNPCPRPMTPTTRFTSATISVYQGGKLVLRQSFTP